MNLHSTLATTTIDRVSLPQNGLDITDRVRTNPFPWTGQFSPQLVERLLVAYASRSSIVLDPFVGSGTSLVEAARLGLSAYGCDLNLAAVILAQSYGMANLSSAQRTAALGELDDRLHEVFAPSCGPLFSADPQESKERSELEDSLISLWSDSKSETVRNLAAALVVLCDFHRENLDAAMIFRIWSRIRKIVLEIPHSTKPIVIQQADARNLPLDSDSVDLVLTSPPYINVLNYHQKYRRSVEALGWNVLDQARSEIGSNRQNRANRFLTVIQYSLDMALAIREMARVAKSESQLILILGRESKVRGVSFFNGELVTEVAVHSMRLKLERRQERVFRNRYGTAIYEDILHFRTTDEIPDVRFVLDVARKMAGRALAAARSSQLPEDTSSGIDDALARLDTVVQSPMLVDGGLHCPERV